MFKKSKRRYQSNFRQPLIKKRRFCYFCKNGIIDIDWQDTETLRHYLSQYGKIKPRVRTGLCEKHQKRIAKKIKIAREMGFLSNT